MENDKKELVSVEESPLGRIVITETQVDLIKKTVAIGATDDELKLFFYECRRRGVHPLDRLIHFIKRGQDEKARATFQAGIDFLRSQAEETNEYRGQDKPEFGSNKEGTNFPEWATITVRRRDPENGEIYPISATAYWDEYYPGDKLGFMWRKMPRSQLAKCAEALALRKAFPKKIAGLYSFEEMEQADVIEIGRPQIQMPQEKKNEALPSNQPDDVISEAQRKRFYAIAKSTKATDDQIKEWLFREYDIEHTRDIPKDLYDEICERVKVELSDEPGSEG